MYHSECLCKLYREANNSRIGKDTNERNHQYHGIAFAKVLAFIDEHVFSSEDVIPVFKLSSLISYYSQCLNELGIFNHYVRSTRFKKRIKGQYEDVIADTQGYDVVLAFNYHIYVKLQVR